MVGRISSWLGALELVDELVHISQQGNDDWDIRLVSGVVQQSGVCCR